jgi:formate dehydrogenase subunit delta
MNIDLLIKMANQIGEFFAGASDGEQAARDVASHLKRYWEPRMRTQIIAYYEQRHGAGLNDTALKGVALLVTESKAQPANPGGATTGAKA